MSASTNIGARLRAERERQARSLAEIAAVTRIPLKSLELMEADRLTELPSKTAARGFIRSYAGALGVDATPLLQSYDGGRPPRPLTPALNTAVVRARQRPRLAVAVAIAVALVVVIVLLTIAIALLLRPRPGGHRDAVSSATQTVVTAQRG